MVTYISKTQTLGAPHFGALYRCLAGSFGLVNLLKENISYFLCDKKRVILIFNLLSTSYIICFQYCQEYLGFLICVQSAQFHVAAKFHHDLEHLFIFKTFDKQLLQAWSFCTIIYGPFGPIELETNMMLWKHLTSAFWITVQENLTLKAKPNKYRYM